MIQKIAIAFLFIMTLSLNGQEQNLNYYQYIIVSNHFDFLKESDQYQTSSFTKFLLKKKGFTVFLSNEQLPVALSENNCLAIKVDVIDDSGLFRVVSRLQFNDCYGNVLFTSEAGKSKEKEYQKAYHEAIRNAFNTLEDFQYSPEPTEDRLPVLSSETTPVAIEVVKEAVKALPVVIASSVSIPLPDKPTIVDNSLYAQEIQNGFQLFNPKNTLIFQILKTNQKDVFIIENTNGVHYKKQNLWIADYYQDGQLVNASYQIQF